MPRTARPDYEPNSILHVICRGVEQRDVFISDQDRMTFLEMVRDAFSRSDVALFSYVLMDNHFHLLVYVSNTRIGIPMHRALTRYAQYFNQTQRRVGHLFQDRFKTKLCLNSAYFVNLVAYIHANPVRAGMVKTAAEWRWSSHDELLKGGGRYLRFDRLEDAVGLNLAELRERYVDGLAPQAYVLTLTELTRQAAYIAGVDLQGIYGGRMGGDYTHAKRILIAWALDEGYSILDLARELGCSPSALYQLHVHRAA